MAGVMRSAQRKTFSFSCTVNTFRTANENFSFSPWRHQCPQTRNSHSRPVLSFLCSFCGSNSGASPSRGIIPEHVLLQYVWSKKTVSNQRSFTPQVQDSDGQSDSEHSDEESRDYLANNTHENQSKDDSESTDDSFDWFTDHQVQLST